MGVNNGRGDAMIDHPYIRAQTVCSLCKGKKDTGLVICWPCYRRHDMRNGGDVVANRLIAIAEAKERGK